MQNRLNKEYQELLKNPPPGVTVTFDQYDRLMLHVWIKGPEDSPYRKGKFYFIIQFPENYPFKQPTCYMNTKIYHTQLRPGLICPTCVLKYPEESWQPTQKTEKFIYRLIDLLRAPSGDLNWGACKNCDILDVFLNDKQRFWEEAEEYTIKYSM